MSTKAKKQKLIQARFSDQLGPLFESLTGDDAGVWGLQAAIFVARYRKKNLRSPTFSELFADVIGSPRLAPLAAEVNWSEEAKVAIYSFRHHVAVHWRRGGWLAWSRSPRSLRPGPSFAAASKAWRFPDGRLTELAEDGAAADV